MPALGIEIRCLWLLPMTPGEVRFKQQNGLEALESLFEEGHIEYLNPGRRSLA